MRILVPGILACALAFTTPLGGALPTEYAEHLLESIKSKPAPTELDLFLNAIGHMESGNRYNITNQYGYMGKYQFGRSTLRGLGYDVSRTTFLSSPDLQEEAMLRLLLHNRDNLQYYINKYDGKKMYGVRVTESGLLAAAHLVGPASVKEFLRTGTITSDRNQTTLVSYMQAFGGYDISEYLDGENIHSLASL